MPAISHIWPTSLRYSQLFLIHLVFVYPVFSFSPSFTLTWTSQWFSNWSLHVYCLSFWKTMMRLYTHPISLPLRHTGFKEYPLDEDIGIQGWFDELYFWSSFCMVPWDPFAPLRSPASGPICLTSWFWSGACFYLFFLAYGSPLHYSCLENPRGQRSLVGYSPWDHKESDTTERLFTSTLIFITLTNVNIKGNSCTTDRHKHICFTCNIDGKDVYPS